MKTFFIKLLKIFLETPKVKPPNLSEIKNVLIIRQHNQLGDMLASVPLFRAIKENIPGCKITLVVSPENIKAVRQNEFISELVLFDKKKIYSIRYLKYLVKSLRGKIFEIGLVPTTISISFTSGLLLRMAKCNYRIGPKSLDGKSFSSSWLFNEAVDFDWRENENLHVTQRILKIVEPLRITTSNLKSHILITEKERLCAKEFFRGVEKFKIGFHIGAGKIQNRWNISKFSELITRLNSKYNTFFFFTVGQLEEELFSELEEIIDVKLTTLRTQTIPEITAIIDIADLFISNDTGIMHVAGATRCPMISLFGPTNPKVWAPIGEKKYFIKKGEDINSIQVDDVLKIAEGILNETN